MPICNIPGAINYGQNGACQFKEEIDGQCRLFEVVPITPEELTISYDPVSDNWVFFHSYNPNVYLRDRVASYCADTVKFYQMNTGPRGTYMDNSTRTAFIIDLVFRWQEEVIIDDVVWNNIVANLPFNTFTHATMFTRDFCTGRIALSNKTTRNTVGNFSFNELRDIVTAQPFRKSVFEDFEVLTTAVDSTMAWFKKGLMRDNYAILRLEYDGSDKIVFIGADASVTRTVR